MSIQKKKSNKSKIAILKYQALKLRANYQLPFYLVYLINQIDDQTPVVVVQFLMTQSEHLLRTKGYYHKYPKIEDDCDRLLKEEYQQLVSK